MSPKAAKETKSKASAKSSKAPAPAAKKSAKGAVKEEKAISAAPVEGEPAVDLEELEEAEAERAAGSGGGGNAAALAAANSGTEMSASFKNFRHHPDMENFYRFIYENDLRHEAMAIIDQIQLEKQARRAAKVGKLNAH